jgi:hypothetical protein
MSSARDQALFGVISHDGLWVDEATQRTVDDIDRKPYRIRWLKNGLGGEKTL